MTSLHQLEKEARERRTQFNATLSDLHGRLTPAGLAKEVLLHTDPHLHEAVASVYGRQAPSRGRCGRDRRRELAA